MKFTYCVFPIRPPRSVKLKLDEVSTRSNSTKNIKEATLQFDIENLPLCFVFVLVPLPELFNP